MKKKMIAAMLCLMMTATTIHPTAVLAAEEQQQEDISASENDAENSSVSDDQEEASITEIAEETGTPETDADTPALTADDAAANDEYDSKTDADEIQTETEELMEETTAADDSNEITSLSVASGETGELTISEEESSVYFSFTPTKTGYYRFDFWGDAYYVSWKLRNEDRTLIRASNTYSGSSSGYTSNCAYYCTAGTTYLLETGFLQGKRSGTLKLSVGECPVAEGSSFSTQISINTPRRTEYVYFIPDESGLYTFSTADAAYPLNGVLSSSSGSTLNTTEGTEEEPNIQLNYNCEAGTGYEIALQYTGSRRGSFTLNIQPASEELTESTITNNISYNNYTRWNTPAYSHLYQDDNGQLVRLEYNRSEGTVVQETYSPSGSFISGKMIKQELPLFGGFYNGEKYNFIVFGAKNPEDSEEQEVLRIVRYDKNWQRLDSCSITGANTNLPFKGGSLRMTETAGHLYVYTCHEMYQSSDGYHHQSNLTFKINEESMEVEDSYYGIMNIAQAGYVSHSFNQLIQTDGTYVYRVDHGDAHPRAVSITKCAVDGSVRNVDYTTVLNILGASGNNFTGVSVGGLELSSDNCIITGNSVDQSDSENYNTSGQRNTFVTVTDKNLKNTNQIWLTDYKAADNITPRTPQLVKISDDKFLVLWEEYHTDTEAVNTRIVTIDGNGTVLSDTISDQYRLSDCQPLVTSDGLVRWYVTDGSSITFYSLNPDQAVTPEEPEKPAISFTDVKKKDYFYDAVQWAVKNGITSGTSGTTFSPNQECTRQQVVMFLWGAAGKPEPATKTNPFTDVKSSSPFYKAILWAVENGITSGITKTTFGPKESCTRQQIVMFLWKYSGTPAHSMTVNPFTDVKSNGTFYNPIMWAFQKGIASGRTAKTFNPKDICTRAQIVTFLYKMNNLS